ncbi:MAG: carboxypeptidase-like regulatory domain-containing protein, partial [Polyangiales bacterium]
LQARFDSDAFWLESSKSAVLALELAPETAPSSVWLLGPLVLSGLALFVLRRRMPKTERVTPAVATERGAGIHPSATRTRLRSEQRDIAGVVLDASTGHPLAGATVSLTSGAALSELATDEQGCFASAELQPGAYRLTVRAPAHREAQGAPSIPHRGQWSAVEIRLESLRDAAVKAYQPVALRALPSPSLWPIWTARETMAHAQRAGRATESFVQLSERVERAAYAEHPPTQDEVANIERAARAADVAKAHERA